MNPSVLHWIQFRSLPVCWLPVRAISHFNERYFKTVVVRLNNMDHIFSPVLYLLGSSNGFEPQPPVAVIFFQRWWSGYFQFTDCRVGKLYSFFRFFVEIPEVLWNRSNEWNKAEPADDPQSDKTKTHLFAVIPDSCKPPDHPGKYADDRCGNEEDEGSLGKHILPAAFQNKIFKREKADRSNTQSEQSHYHCKSNASENEVGEYFKYQRNNISKRSAASSCRCIYFTAESSSFSSA